MLPTTVQGPVQSKGEGGHLMMNIYISPYKTETRTFRNPTSFVCNGVCCQARSVSGEECTPRQGARNEETVSCGKIH